MHEIEVEHWNALPDSLVSITSLQSFWRHLKTFLFQRSFS